MNFDIFKSHFKEKRNQNSGKLGDIVGGLDSFKEQAREDIPVEILKLKDKIRESGAEAALDELVGGMLLPFGEILKGAKAAGSPIEEDIQVRGDLLKSMIMSALVFLLQEGKIELR